VVIKTAKDSSPTVYARSEDHALLYPGFWRVLQLGLLKARAAGHDIYMFEGWRSEGRQNKLFASGRTSPGPIVTNCEAWQSWHQYGLAADLVFGGPGKWSWKGDYKAIGKIMQSVGLEWFGSPGTRFPELSHVQLTYGLNIAEMKQLVLTSGLVSVWLRASARAVDKL